MKWKITAEGAELTDYTEDGSHAEIPAKMEEKPVTAIGPKAFLSRKNLQKVRLPASVQRIGSWAFAHALSLETIYVYGYECEADYSILLGRDVFLGCDRLDFFAYENDTCVGISALRAAAARIGASELVRPAKEDRQGAWLADWDALLLSFLEEEDAKGFRPMQAGGEEDYESEQEQRRLYEKGRRKRKAELCYLRLKYDRDLEKDNREYLSGFLCRHKKAAWEILLEKHLQEKDYYRILYQSGGISQENIKDILLDMERAGAGAEQRAFLLDHMRDARIQGNSPDSFFQSFQL